MSAGVTCPPWCVIGPEDHDDDDPGRPIHVSGLIPAGGWFYAVRVGDDAPRVQQRGRRRSEMTAAECRELAAACLKAAEWLEGSR